MKASQWLQNNVLQAYKKSWRLFPLTLLAALALVVITIYQVEKGFDLGDLLNRVQFALLLLVPLSILATLESKRKAISGKGKQFILYAIAIILAALYAWLFLPPDMNMVERIRYFLLMAAIYLLCTVWPAWPSKKQNFSFFAAKIITELALTFLCSLVMFLGLLAIFFAIDELLFNINIEFAPDIAIAVAGVFAPAFFLARLPLDEPLEETDFSRILRLLLNYIILPLLLIYSLVLYIYFVKVLVGGIWPSGVVCWLVLIAAVVGILTILLLRHIKVNTFVTKTFRWYPIALLPLLGMMFFSVAKRIAEYGLTEMRCYIIIAGCWLVFACLYFAISKKATNSILAWSLAAIIILSVVGPWSVFNLAINSQTNRLSLALQAASILQEDGTLNPNSTLKEEGKYNISSILYFLDSRDAINQITYFPAELKENFNGENVVKYLGFEYSYGSYYYNRGDVNTLCFYCEKRPAENVSGYDWYLANFDLTQKYNNELISIGNDISIKNESSSKPKIIISYKDEVDFEIDVFSALLAFYEENADASNFNVTLDEPLIIEAEGQKLAAKVFIIEGCLYKENGEISVNWLNLHLLIKEK